MNALTDSYYPPWLGSAVVAGNAPWPEALRTTLPEFLKSYTLHDSLWLGLYLECGREGLLVVRWDTHWTKGRVPYPGSLVSAWPILLCRLKGLNGVHIALAEDGIADAESAPQHISPEELHHHTVITAHDGSTASLAHAPSAELLCLSASGERVPIPI